MSAPSATNVNRDTTAADYLNWLRQWALSQQAINSAGTTFTPNYIMQQNDIIDISDSVSIGPVEPAADTIDIGDSMTLTTQNTGTFKYDTAEYNFGDYA